jgi:hypothetical protein
MRPDGFAGKRRSLSERSEPKPRTPLIAYSTIDWHAVSGLVETSSSERICVADCGQRFAEWSFSDRESNDTPKEHMS